MRSELVIFTLALLACAGGEPATEAPTFADVQSEVLAGCAFSSCHGSGTGGLTLDGTSADHGRLVDAESAAAPGETLVIPGDPDGSYLVKKLEGADGIVGDPMPQSAPLADDKLQLVRDWIEAGAAP